MRSPRALPLAGSSASTANLTPALRIREIIACATSVVLLRAVSPRYKSASGCSQETSKSGASFLPNMLPVVSSLSITSSTACGARSSATASDLASRM